VSVYYNENDPRAAEWLRQLIKAGEIPEGVVDERSIHDVKARELKSFTQCHFFAGIGGWAEALRLSGWGERPVWTGSCPCQPFSAAGKGLGQDDPRHLWPVWFELIRQCRPVVIFGEQVASRAALSWLDTVQDDLESEGYATGAVDLCAAGVGAPHIRQRLYWVAESVYGGLGEGAGFSASGYGESKLTFNDGGFVCGMADAGGERRQQERGSPSSDEKTYGRRTESDHQPAGCIAISTLVDPNGRDSGPERQQRSGQQRFEPQDGGLGRFMGHPDQPGPQGRSLSGADTSGYSSDQCPVGPSSLDGRGWADCEWLPCTDGKARPIEPGSFPLAYGIPGRVGLLRGYGNAIVTEAAAEFIQAYMSL
jgi:site-specific DNA-cytosine methylase